MAELIFKSFNYSLPDPQKDTRGAFKKGFFITAEPDGHPWGSDEIDPNKNIIIKCPEITLEQARKYCIEYFQSVNHRIVNYDAAQGGYRIDLYTDNYTKGNIGHLSKDRALNWLSELNAQNVSLVDNAVRFDILVFDTTASKKGIVQSSRFWLINAENLIFSRVNYNQAKELQRIVMDYGFYAQKEYSGQVAEQRITFKSGSVINNDTDLGLIEFSITNTQVLKWTNDYLKKSIRDLICPRRYKISEADIDAIKAAGGSVTLSKSQLLSKVIDMKDVL